MTRNNVPPAIRTAVSQSNLSDRVTALYAGSEVPAVVELLGGVFPHELEQFDGVDAGRIFPAREGRHLKVTLREER